MNNILKAAHHAKHLISGPTQDQHQEQAAFK
jgi:hypothetical protein